MTLDRMKNIGQTSFLRLNRTLCTLGRPAVKMNIITGFITLSLLAGFSAAAATFVSDGSASDTQAKINLCVDGDTVQLPAGTFTWSSGVAISSKGIRLQGAGAGRVIGRSASSLTIGTGTRTLVTQVGLSISVGQVLAVERTGTPHVYGAATGVRTYMIGTVTSYSGSNLTLNVTSTGGSGTHPLWIISTDSQTTINNTVSGTMLSLSEDATHHVEVAGIKFTRTGWRELINITGSGKPVLIHDCYFESGPDDGATLIALSANRLILWECSFAAFPFCFSTQPIRLVGAVNTWTYASTMGMNDATGINNIYVEDCDFNAFQNCTDLDNSARAVLRYNLFNNAGCGTHGADTSNYGVRHYEWYNNTFLFNGYNDGNTMNLNYQFYLRGGTGVFADNNITPLSSSDYGTKSTIKMTVMNLQRNGGPNPCWGAGIAGIQYPAPRQVGMGYVTGTAGNDSFTYKGDSEPIYVWGNSGTVNIGLSDYGGTECGSPDSTSDYIQLGRDYFLSAKPGYAKYTYPHPMRTGAAPVQIAPAVTSNPQSLTLNQGQPATFSVSVAGSTPLAYQWQKNLANIAGATAASYTDASVQTNDVGSYRCVVTNAYGLAASAAATLTVNIPVPVPASITTNPQSITLTVGQSATFAVTAIGDSPMSYQWQKNSANISGATSASYTIASAQTNNAGSYWCVVSNAYGSATSAAATLTVNIAVPVPASITANPQSITGSVGQSATFSVTASGDAPMSYQWQKNSANISGATSANFTIAIAQTNDAGSFRCIASNAYGSATSAAATLTVSAAATGNLRYVDQTAGNDSNAGTVSSPWQRCPSMVGWSGSATLQPGDTVYFDRSDTWDIGAITFGAGLDLKAGVHYIGNQWDPAGVGAGRARLRAVGTHDSGNVRFWEDHLTIPTEFDGFEVDGNGFRADGIDINHSHLTTGLADAVKRITNCVVHGQAGDQNLGDYKYGVIVSDNSTDASGRVANVEILDTLVYDVPRVGIALYPGDRGMLSNIVVRGCETHDPYGDPNYQQYNPGIAVKGDVRNSVIENCYVHDVGGAAVFISGPETAGAQGPTGLTVRYNVLQSVAVDGVIRFYKEGNKSADVYGNIVLQNEAGGGLSFAGNSGTIAAKICNNTFYNSFVDLGSPTSTGTIEFNNNIIYELDDTPLNDPGAKITSHANNVFFRSGGGTLVNKGGTTYSSSTLTSYEPTASSSNPLFKNTASLPTGFTGTYGVNLAPNSDGLSLQTNSPSQNTAVALATPFNGSINSVTRPSASGWDIGAYQHAAGASATPPEKVTGVHFLTNSPPGL